MYIAAGCVLCFFKQRCAFCSICKTDLADNTVSAVYKDKEGFVWFGTRNGLSRYDGRRITNFERSRSYPSISNLKEVFDGVLAFVDNGVFSAFDLKKRTVFVCGFFFGTGYSISRDVAEE